jgi:hypothetical protein
MSKTKELPSPQCGTTRANLSLVTPPIPHARYCLPLSRPDATGMDTRPDFKPYIRKVCRSNAERKNNFYCSWLWGKAIKAEGGTPGPLEVSPRSSPPLSSASSDSICSGPLRSDLGPTPTRPTSSSEAPTGRRPGRATRRADPRSWRGRPTHAEQIQPPTRATPTRAEGRGPTSWSRGPRSRSGSREPRRSGTCRRSRQSWRLTRDTPSCYEIQPTRGRASAIGAEPVPRSTRAIQTYTPPGERRTRGNVGAEIQPTRASRRGPGRCALLMPPHTPSSSGPGRCALVEATTHAEQIQGPGRCALLRPPATPSSSSRPAPRQQQAQGDEGQGDRSENKSQRDTPGPAHSPTDPGASRGKFRGDCGTDFATPM